MHLPCELNKYFETNFDASLNPYIKCHITMQGKPFQTQQNWMSLLLVLQKI